MKKIIVILLAAMLSLSIVGIVAAHGSPEDCDRGYHSHDDLGCHEIEMDMGEMDPDLMDSDGLNFERMDFNVLDSHTVMYLFEDVVFDGCFGLDHEAVGSVGAGVNGEYFTSPALNEAGTEATCLTISRMVEWTVNFNFWSDWD